MNTCFRISLAALSLCTLVFADEAPVLQTPPEILARTGTDKSWSAARTPPEKSTPVARDGVPRELSQVRSDRGVVRLYVLNMFPNPGDQKASFNDDITETSASDDSSIAGRVRLTNGEADDVPSVVEQNSGYPEQIALVRRQLTIEGPLEVAPAIQDASREFGVQLAPGGPLAPLPIEPGLIPALPESSESDRSSTGDFANADRPGSLKPMSEIRLSAAKPVTDSGDSSHPQDRAAQRTEGWGGMMDTTPPPQRYFPRRNSYPIRHNPLYFEDPNLERCGLGHGCLTDAASLVRFAGRVPFITYMMAVNPPHSCVRAKPDCPTCHSFGLDAYIPNPGELDVAAAAVHAAVVVGVVFLIP